MKHCTRGFMAEKLRAYNESNLYSLSNCYLKASDNKESAYDYCVNLMQKYNGENLRIISYNTFSFSAGFIGEYNGKRAFFYITKDYDRYIYIN